MQSQSSAGGHHGVCPGVASRGLVFSRLHSSGDGQPVPGVDGRDGEGEVGEFLIGEVGANGLGSTSESVAAKDVDSVKVTLFFQASVKGILARTADAELICFGMLRVQEEIYRLRDDGAWYPQQGGLLLLQPSGSEAACDFEPRGPNRREIRVVDGVKSEVGSSGAR